jgi:hypothetical protein
MVMNNVNGKYYIGQTQSHYGKKPHGINGRFSTHKSWAKSKKISKNTACPHLYNAIRKYGL